jgi:hypothetical protein
VRALSRELNLVARRVEVRAQGQAAVATPRSERFLSEDAERATGDEMALDLKIPWRVDSGWR